MSEWLTDTEKRLLLSALSREKKVCIQVDNECCREPYEDRLEDVCKSLEYKFYYDRLFKHIEKQIRVEAIDECIQEIKDTWLIFEIGVVAEVIKKLEQLKEK